VFLRLRSAQPKLFVGVVTCLAACFRRRFAQSPPNFWQDRRLGLYLLITSGAVSVFEPETAVRVAVVVAVTGVVLIVTCALF
jgi:hypothetical protein